MADQRRSNGGSKGGDEVEGLGGLSLELRVGGGENKRNLGVLECGAGGSVKELPEGTRWAFFFCSDLAQNDVVLARSFKKISWAKTTPFCPICF